MAAQPPEDSPGERLPERPTGPPFGSSGRMERYRGSWPKRLVLLAILAGLGVVAWLFFPDAINKLSSQAAELGWKNVLVSTLGLISFIGLGGEILFSVTWLVWLLWWLRSTYPPGDAGTAAFLTDLLIFFLLTVGTLIGEFVAIVGIIATTWPTVVIPIILVLLVLFGSLLIIVGTAIWIWRDIFIAFVRWLIYIRRLLCFWATTTERVCAQRRRVGIQRCVQWEAQRYQRCAQWATITRQVCAVWRTVSRRICTAYSTTMTRRCSSWHWTISWLCLGWTYITTTACVAFSVVTSTVCDQFVTISTLACIVWVWVTSLVCKLWQWFWYIRCAAWTYVVKLILICW